MEQKALLVHRFESVSQAMSWMVSTGDLALVWIKISSVACNCFDLKHRLYHVYFLLQTRSCEHWQLFCSRQKISKYGILFFLGAQCLKCHFVSTGETGKWLDTTDAMSINNTQYAVIAVGIHVPFHASKNSWFNIQNFGPWHKIIEKHWYKVTGQHT